MRLERMQMKFCSASDGRELLKQLPGMITDVWKRNPIYSYRAHISEITVNAPSVTIKFKVEEVKETRAICDMGAAIYLSKLPARDVIDFITTQKEVRQIKEVHASFVLQTKEPFQVSKL